MSVVDEIKARLDIVDVIGAYVPLKRSGKNYKALCPFHQEKTPSFIVFPETQTWHCFGACHTGGDIFTFIMKREGVDFSTALRLLAERAGITLAEAEEDTAAQLRERLREMHAAAAAYYQDILQRHPEAQAARDYLRRRGLRAETLQAFQIGYALNRWDGLLTYLHRLGYTEEEMVQGGLVIRQENGRVYDRFRGRVMFPIHDPQGRVVAFAGRVLDQGEPKYLNSPQTPIFDKKRTLYGYAQAVPAIREHGEVVVVEGYTDVLSAHQAGFRHIVASMGTALTTSHLRLLARHARRIILALDADTAGIQAALRGIDVAREALAHEVVPMITPTGAVRFTTTLGVDLRILRLPTGKDPDDVLREAPETWRHLVQGAIPVLDFYLDHITNTVDIHTPQGKQEAVQLFAPLLREVDNATLRDHYLQQLARLLRIDERALAQDIWHTSVPPRPMPKHPTSARPAQKRTDLERYLVAYLLRWPHLLKRLGEHLQRLGQPELRLEELHDVRHRLILQVLLTLLIGGNLSTVEDILTELPSEVAPYVQELMRQAATLPQISEPVALQEIVATLLRLRLQRTREAAYQMRYLMEEAEQQGDRPLLLTYGVQLRNLLHTIRDLERLLPAITAGY